MVHSSTSARREIKRLKTFLGRVHRDIRRKIAHRPELAEAFARPLTLVERFLPGADEKHSGPGTSYSIVAPRQAIDDCVVQRKANPKPFVWTAPANRIIGKVDRRSRR